MGASEPIRVGTPEGQPVPPNRRLRLAVPEAPSRPSVLITSIEWDCIAKALQLSPRAVQVSQAFMDGLDELGAAQQIGVSVHTVHTYIRRMYRTLNVNSRGEYLSRLFAACLGQVTDRESRASAVGGLSDFETTVG